MDADYKKLVASLRDHQNGGRRQECEDAAASIEVLCAVARMAAQTAAEYLEAKRVIDAGPPRPDSGFATPRSWRPGDPEVRRFHAAVAALNALAAQAGGE